MKAHLLAILANSLLAIHWARILYHSLRHPGHLSAASVSLVNLALLITACVFIARQRLLGPAIALLLIAAHLFVIGWMIYMTGLIMIIFFVPLLVVFFLNLYSLQTLTRRPPGHSPNADTPPRDS
jgi:hypothetical protein